MILKDRVFGVIDKNPRNRRRIKLLVEQDTPKAVTERSIIRSLKLLVESGSVVCQEYDGEREYKLS